MNREIRALHSQKQRCLSMESDNVSNAGFLYGAQEEGFHPILSQGFLQSLTIVGTHGISRQCQKIFAFA